jgi:hypothetical protein
MRAIFGFPFPLVAVYYRAELARPRNTEEGPEQAEAKTSGMQMLEFNPYPSPHPSSRHGVRSSGAAAPDQAGEKNLEARVKPDCVHLYPGVDPKTWYQVVQEGEYRDEMEGLWIQVSDWVTYVLAKHFDLQSRPGMH